MSDSGRIYVAGSWFDPTHASLSDLTDLRDELDLAKRRVQQLISLKKAYFLEEKSLQGHWVEKRREPPPPEEKDCD